MRIALQYEKAGAEAYRSELSGRADVPLWQQPWWLEAASGGEWGAITLGKSDRVVAALPYAPHRRLGLEVWMVPPLTKSLGPWIEPRSMKHVKRQSLEVALLGALADAIPEPVYYHQTWTAEQSNWLPFYWRGFRQTTCYTYRLALGESMDNLWRGLSDDTRNVIRKAENRYGVTVTESPTLDEVLDLNQRSFARQGVQSPYRKETIERIHQAAKTRGACSVYVAHESDGTPSAAAYIVRDAQTAYYLIGGSDPTRRHSGAQNLVLWHAITQEIGRSERFDFEGSMVESIERSFRSYGSLRVPLLVVSGSRSRRGRTITPAALRLRAGWSSLR